MICLRRLGIESMYEVVLIVTLPATTILRSFCTTANARTLSGIML